MNNIHRPPTSKDAVINYEPGNCLTSYDSLVPGETHSYICPHTILTSVVLIYKNAEDYLRVCEVELYRDTDKTDIPLPTWESAWTELEDFSANESRAYNHSLHVTPVYGRILLKPKSDGNNSFMYSLDGTILQQPEIGLKGHLYLSYNKEQYLLSMVTVNDYFICLNDSWTKPGCIKKTSYLYKVQLWTSCGFPRPSFMSPWQSRTSNESVVIEHQLGKLASFGFMQVEYIAKLDGQVYITQIHGFPLSEDSHSEATAMYYSDNHVVLHMEHWAIYYRAFLWQKLTKAPPVYQETFPIRGFVGPERLKLPPYALERSIVTAVVSILDNL